MAEEEDMLQEEEDVLQEKENLKDGREDCLDNEASPGLRRSKGRVSR